MRTKALLRSLAITSALLLLAGGCGTAPDAGGSSLDEAAANCDPSVSEDVGDTIKIGVTTALSGPAAAYGASSVGFRAMVDEINAAGGIDGRQIEVKVLDDQLDPAKAVANVNELLSKEKVDMFAVVPGITSALAIKDTIVRNCVPNLFALAGDTKLDNHEDPWTVKGLAGYDVEVDTLVESIKQRHPDGAKVALMYDNNEGGHAWTDLAKDALKGTEWEVVAEQTIEATDVAPPTSQVTTLAGSKADVVLSWLTVGQCAPFLQEVSKSGWDPEIYQTVNCFSSEAVMQPAGKAADGVLQAGWLRTFTTDQAQGDPSLKTYLDSLKSTDSSVSPASFASAGYAFGAGVVAVLEDAASGDKLSRESIMKSANELAPTESPLLVDGVTFSSGPDHAGFVPSMVMQEWDATKQEWVASK